MHYGRRCEPRSLLRCSPRSRPRRRAAGPEPAAVSSARSRRRAPRPPLQASPTPCSRPGPPPPPRRPPTRRPAAPSTCTRPAPTTPTASRRRDRGGRWPGSTSPSPSSRCGTATRSCSRGAASTPACSARGSLPRATTASSRSRRLRHGQRTRVSAFKTPTAAGWRETAPGSGRWQVDLAATGAGSDWLGDASSSTANVGFLKVNDEIRAYRRGSVADLRGQWEFASPVGSTVPRSAATRDRTPWAASRPPSTTPWSWASPSSCCAACTSWAPAPTATTTAPGCTTC